MPFNPYYHTPDDTPDHLSLRNFVASCKRCGVERFAWSTTRLRNPGALHHPNARMISPEPAVLATSLPRS